VSPISGSILGAKLLTSIGSARLEVRILWACIYDLLRIDMLAPKSSNNRPTYSCSPFFKIILMICLRPPVGSGSFGQLGLVAESES
jgi:hypothetical protein